MLQIGDVVQATVTDVRVFGVFCSYNSNKLLVLIPDTSWIASFCSCEQFAEVGDELTVKIKNVAPTGEIAGTIKELHPNPWETHLLKIGTEHMARIVRFVPKADRCKDQAGYLVELVPGAFAMLCAGGCHFSAGDQIPVVIQQSDSFNHSVSLALQRKDS